MRLFDKELAKCNTDHEDWQKLEKTYIMHLICNKRVMMALDCSRGKRIFLAWRKDIFKVFCIYIYIRPCPLLVIYFFSLVIQINLKKLIDIHLWNICTKFLKLDHRLCRRRTVKFTLHNSIYNEK